MSQSSGSGEGRPSRGEREEAFGFEGGQANAATSAFDAAEIQVLKAQRTQMHSLTQDSFQTDPSVDSVDFQAQTSHSASD